MAVSFAACKSVGFVRVLLRACPCFVCGLRVCVLPCLGFVLCADRDIGPCLSTVSRSFVPNRGAAVVRLVGGWLVGGWLWLASARCWLREGGSRRVYKEEWILNRPTLLTPMAIMARSSFTPWARLLSLALLTLHTRLHK